MAGGSDFQVVFLLIGLFLIFIKSVHVLMKRLDLPDVLGEVSLGFILGPSLIGIYHLKDHPESLLSSLTFLGLNQNILDDSGLILSFIAEFAVLILLFEVGTEIDFDVLKKVKKPAGFAAMGGIFLPLILGLSFLAIVAGLNRSLVIPEGVEFWDTGLFMAVALTATSIGISTRIFLDLNKITTKVAQTVVGAAIFDDIISVTALALVIAYVGGLLSGGSVGLIILRIALFFVISFLLFKFGIPWAVDKTKVVKDRSFVIFFSISFMMLMSVLAQALQLEPIIGAFVAGVIIGNEDDFLDIHADITPIANWIVPFFFINIGLQIDLGPILSADTVVATVTLGLSLATIAILAKYFGGSLGAKFAGYGKNESKAIGLSMAAKGEVTLIFATTAYSLGYFTDTLFAAVISLVMIDSLVIPTLLKIGIEKWITDDS